MCSEFKILICVTVLLLFSCTPYKNMQKVSQGQIGLGLSVQEKEVEEEPEVEAVVDSMWDTVSDGPIIMNAIKDTETGEMVATDIINASKVVARFRNVAERDGFVSIGFNVHVPGELSQSRWQLKIVPKMRIQEDTLVLEPIYVTGKGYREMQMRGYQRYQAFLASIITDTTDLVRLGQLEIFLQRHFPLTYAMKTDSTFIPEPMAENLFGVTQKEALIHYTRHWKVRRNEWKKNNKDRMFRKYVKDPIVREGLRLDTVLMSGTDFIYKYIHTFKSRPGLKKVMLTLDGRLYERGECIASLPFPEELTFYISSLSTLADEKTRYKIIVLERNAYDNTKALIDFHQGSSEIDTTLGDNASEFRRISRCIEDVVAREEYVLDSLMIMASCSPEGAYSLNSKLAAARSDAVGKYIEDAVPEDWVDRIKTVALPENWDQLRTLVANDTVLEPAAIRRILSMTENITDYDRTEHRLSGLSHYRYLREKIYPKIRSVRFDFYLHRKGMIKDTVHTTLVDSVYMAGLRALKDLDYKRAVELLRPYDDYNSALAFMSAGYNHSALDVMGRLKQEDPKVCYLMAMVLSRLGQLDEAMKYFELCLAYDPYMVHRANLDPEMSELVKRMN